MHFLILLNHDEILYRKFDALGQLMVFIMFGKFVTIRENNSGL